MEHYDEKGMVICQECGKSFYVITVQHLMKSHNITFKDYVNKYPGCPTLSKSSVAKRKFTNIKIFKETNDLKISPEEIKIENYKEDILTDDLKILPPEEIKIEDYGDIDIDKIPSVPKTYLNEIPDFMNEVKSFSTEKIEVKFPNPTNSIHKDKMKFLNYFLFYFGKEVKNSYFVDKITGSGTLEERIVTDIALPSLKIDIEFPNTFWHNKDMSKQLRDSKLKTLKWTVIDVPGSKPSISDLKIILKKFNLI